MELTLVLKEVFQHCMDMQKNAETKNAGLLAFNGAITLSMIKLATDDKINCYWKLYFSWMLACSIIAIIINLLAIVPRLKHKAKDKSINRLKFKFIKRRHKYTYKRNAVVRRKKKYLNRVASKKERPNLLYFDMVARYRVDYYLEQLQIYYCFKVNASNYEYDLAKQVVINAQIASKKFKLFRRAQICTMTGIGTPLFLPIFYIFLDNNK